MTLRLTIDRAAWTAHVDDVAARYPGIVPVVKGNGYGFGRAALFPLARTISHEVCVGSIYEITGAPANVRPVVLTPAAQVPPTLDGDVILTVGSTHDVDALGDWRGEVIVKLRSSMQRFGTTPDELPAVLDALDGRRVHAFGLHLPLAGSDDDRRAEIDAWLEVVDADTPVWLSHLGEAAESALRAAYPLRTFRQRIGTRLWHGPKSFVHLGADVLAVHPVRAGQVAGYHASHVPADGHLVVIGAGSAAGVATNDGASPFHFARTRLALLEGPHMHVSMCHVPDDAPCPQVGDEVDVQRPLILVHPDVTDWT